MPQLKRKQYPYPDENVFLVVGSPDGTANLTKEAVVVAKTAEVAKAWYESTHVNSTQQFKVLSTTSLRELRLMKQHFESAEKSPAIENLSTKRLSGIFSKLAIWLVTAEGADGITLKLVKARNSQEVNKHFSLLNMRILILVTKEMVQEAIRNLDNIKNGSGAVENYAFDIQGGEHLRDAASFTATLSDEQRRDNRLLWQEAMAKR